MVLKSQVGLQFVLKKAPENQENINLTAGAANAHNTHKRIMKRTANAHNLICRCFFLFAAH